MSLLIPALFLLISSCRHEEAQVAEQGYRRILFVGNSLTYTNDLPGMVEKMFEQTGVEFGAIEAITGAGFGLQDHFASERTVRMIAEGEWDLVIVQQGASATEGRPSLMEYSKKIDEMIRPAGRVGLYMVWPARTRYFDYDGVFESYHLAAEAVEGLFFPAGEAWRLAWLRDPSIELYDRDGLHPSLYGTYLAALVIFGQLSGRDPRELPAIIPTRYEDLAISEKLAQDLQEAAAEANEKYAR